jgi:putative hydrolase of the HAD superfamily
MTIDGITFDFWNTLYTDRRDGSAEIARELRMASLRRAVEECGGRPDADRLAEANRAGFGAYLEAWRAGRHYGAREHVLYVLGRFGLSSRDGVVDRAAMEIEDLGAQADLILLPGAAEAIPKLAAAGIHIGLISDTGLTPGRVLTGFLERDGLLPHFSTLTFSDITGYPKPDRRMFEATLSGMGVEPGRAMHVGDTPRTDIAGALQMGMRAVRFAAANDVDEPPPADAVICDHTELFALAGLG